MQRCLVAFGLLAWHSNKAAQQQLLEHIYWNFVESDVLEIEIWLNLWVSASNELGRVLEEGSLVVIVKIVKRMPGRDKKGREYEKKCPSQEGGSRPRFAQAFPLPPPPFK